MAWTVFIIASLLNWAWEVARLSVYEGFENASATYSLIHCRPATAMDTLFILGIYYSVRMLLRDRQWISHLKVLGHVVVMLTGAAVAAITEKAALKLGWWSYGAISLGLLRSVPGYCLLRKCHSCRQ